MVRTAAETFFYNFNESKFFKDESKYLRVERQVCTISTPPVDHLRIIDDLYRGAEIFMTLYPQKPGTYFGAEICRCQWEPRCCRRAMDGEVREHEAPIEEAKKQNESKKLGFSSPSAASKRASVLKGMPGDGPPAKNSRSSPEKVLRMKKSVVQSLESGVDVSPRKSLISPGQENFGMQTASSDPETPTPRKSKCLFDDNEPYEINSADNVKRQKDADSMASAAAPPRPSGAYPPRSRTSTDGLLKSGRSVSRVTIQPGAEARNEAQQDAISRRPTTTSQPMARRRTTWGFIDMKTPSRSQSRQGSPSQYDQMEQLEPSYRKSQMRAGDSPLTCYQCRKCTEKLCLKCRMPVDSCCCGIPNFLYCRECEENIAVSAKNVGDPFKCRKCDQKLCLVCRQHVDSCCCPKPNFFMCRSCETRRRTRCCIPVQR